MRITVRPISSRLKDVRSWLLLLGVTALWGIATAFDPGSASGLRASWLPPCPLRKATGIPCPFCGITTGSCWIARGHWRLAWDSNVLSPPFMIGALALGIYVLTFRLAAGRTVILEPQTGARRLFWLCFLGLIATSWGFNLLRAFP